MEKLNIFIRSLNLKDVHPFVLALAGIGGMTIISLFLALVF